MFCTGSFGARAFSRRVLATGSVSESIECVACKAAEDRLGNVREAFFPKELRLLEVELISLRARPGARVYMQTGVFLVDAEVRVGACLDNLNMCGRKKGEDARG